jgi:hypothetical protein
MKVPTIGSKIKIRVSYGQGPRMVPPQAGFHEYEGEVVQSYKWLNDRQFCMTGNSEWPVRVISMDLVEDIQLLKGKFVEVDTGIKVFTVKGSKGNTYTVTRNGRGWNCTCPGHQFRRQCKHVSELSGVK